MRYCFVLMLITLACSEDTEPKGCFECTTVVLMPDASTTTRKSDRCDLDAYEALQLNSAGPMTVVEVIDGVSVETQQTTNCERK